MAYSILSIGDAEMMYNAFNGVAMVFASDNMNTLMKIGFLIGLFLVAFQYMFELKFPLYSILVAYIVSAAMFIPKDTVIIEDIYTGQVYTVANVPLGISLPMSIVSTIGVNTTQVYETVFSTPDEAHLLESGYLQPLSTLIKLRNIGLGTASSDITFNGSLSDSLNSYIEGCVMYDIALQIPESEHEVTRERLLKAEDIWVAMKTTFINKDVLVDLPTFSGQQSCKDAYALLDVYINTPEFATLWEQYMRGVLDIKDSSVSPDDLVTQSTQALGMVAINSQTYMRNGLMAAYLRDGPSAFIERTGIEQLRLQWSGEQSLFTQISRPLTAFIEIFTVAISPIVAFLTTLGLMGIKMIARYFQMLIWIALWGPITAVCNLYIAMVTTRIMTTISDQAEANGTSLMAMVSHDQLYGTLETWLATGGMLASSVPALALMLVYGGANAAVNLAGRMTSGASAAVKPERVMPEPVSIAATTSIASQRSMDSNSGQTVSGWTEGTYSMASGSQKSQQSAFSSLQSANASASQAFNNLTQHTDTKGNTVTDGTTITDALNKSHSASDRWAAATGKAIAERVGRTDGEKEFVNANVGTKLALGASAGAFKALSLDGSMGLDSSSGISADRRKELLSEADKAWRSEYANTDETRSAHDYAKAHSDQSIFSSQDMKAKSENYMAQLARVDQAQQAYQESVTDSQTSGQNLTLKHSELAQRLVQTGANADLANVERDIAMHGTDKEKANWQQAKQDAAKQLDAGAARIPKTSKEYEALWRFLALDEIDSQRAFHIASSTFEPTGNKPELSVSGADDYKNAAKTPDDLLGRQQADSFADQARGQTSDVTAATDPIPHSALQSGLNAKVAGPHPQPMNIPRGSNANVKQSVNGILNGANIGEPDDMERRIKSGPLIKEGQDTSHLMGGAVKNEGGALYDNTVVAGARPLDRVGKAIGGAVYDAEAYLKDAVTGEREKPVDKPRKPFDELPDIKQ
jgi:hypothetical protein